MTTAGGLRQIHFARATGLALHWIRLAGARVEFLLAEVEANEVATVAPCSEGEREAVAVALVMAV